MQTYVDKDEVGGLIRLAAPQSPDFLMKSGLFVFVGDKEGERRFAADRYC